MDIKKSKIAIIGLGYVGLPLAIEFGKKYFTIGFDIDNSRVNKLKKYKDETNEISYKDFKSSSRLSFTSSVNNIKQCSIFIITVPTPVNSINAPNLSFLKKASELVGSVIKKNSIIIYESTVYPGATEEFCAPIIEKNSNLKLNKDFFLGYSPERINPGDKKHKLTNITKVVSASNIYSLKIISNLYRSIIKARIFKAESIKVAEAAKVIENTQRDLNISLMNELSIIFDKLNINTNSVIEAANTKWNFQKFKPGLVGGHCIGVDPYYLTHKAKEVGYKPRVILAGRAINDQMSKNVSNRIIKKMKLKGLKIKNSKALVLGFTFKENCPDIRNTKVRDLIHELQLKLIKCDVYDPYIKSNPYSKNTKIKFLKKFPKFEKYTIIVLAVKHKEFVKLPYNELSKIMLENNVLFDLQNIFPSELVDGHL